MRAGAAQEGGGRGRREQERWRNVEVEGVEEGGQDGKTGGK